MADGQTLIGSIIENVLVNFPDSEIIVTIGFEADKMIAELPDTIHVVENQLFKESNTLEEVRLGLNVATNENVLIIHGDLIFNHITLENVAGDGSTLIVDSNGQIDEMEVGVTTVDNKATILAYELDARWCHIVYLTGKELERFRKVVKNRNRSKWFVFEAINAVIKSGGKFSVIEPRHMEISRVEKSKDWKTLR